MKMQFSFNQCALLLVLLLCHSKISAGVVQIDPALATAITTQMVTLSNIYSKRENTQNKIIAAEATVTLAMKRMHDVEDKVLSYMANVQGAFQNLYQIKRAGELVAKEIPENMNNVRQAIKAAGFQGTFMATTVGSELKSITMDMMSLYPFMSQLVTSGTYNTTDFNESGDVVQKRNKVNLLNAAERYYICNTVVDRLENINTSLYLLSWEIRTMRWRDLFFKLDPEGWASVMTAQNIVNGIIADWNYSMTRYN